MGCKRVFTILAALLLCLAQIAPVTASEKALVASISVDSLFDSMEKCADQINAISASVILQNSAASKSVTLSIKSPDKFAIIFADGSVKAMVPLIWIRIYASRPVPARALCVWEITPGKATWIAQRYIRATTAFIC